jgi:hypothetical protein
MATAHPHGRSAADDRRQSRIGTRYLSAHLDLADPLIVLGYGRRSRSNKWWWDNLAGPDSSNFVASDQIKKANVSQLEVAWFYPYATPGFNPIVVR